MVDVEAEQKEIERLREAINKTNSAKLKCDYTKAIERKMRGIAEAKRWCSMNGKREKSS